MKEYDLFYGVGIVIVSMNGLMMAVLGPKHYNDNSFYGIFLRKTNKLLSMQKLILYVDT